MKQKQTPAQRIEKGDRARAIFESETFAEVMRKLRASLHEQWEQSPVGNTEAHHSLKLQLKAIGDIETTLKRMITDAKMAKAQIERKE